MAGDESHLTESRRKLLAALLPHIAFDGWTERAMQRATDDAGLPQGERLRLFPQGPVQALNFWIAETDAAMVARLEAEDTVALRGAEKVRRAILIRLEMVAPHREAVRRAITLQALPHHAPDALRMLYRTVDCIWRAAGDKATDWNFYSKRALLAAVYSSTLAIWLDDSSEGFAATEAFLDRRLADVMRFGKVKDRVTGLLGRAPDALEKLRRRASVRTATKNG